MFITDNTGMGLYFEEVDRRWVFFPLVRIMRSQGRTDSVQQNSKGVPLKAHQHM
jgi:hypothetical protein